MFDKNPIDSVIYRKRNKTIKISIILFFLISVVIVSSGFIYLKTNQNAKINQLILKSNNTRIELENIKQLKLWDKTLEKIKKDQLALEIKYDQYKITLNNASLQKENNIDLEIKNTNTYSEFENTNLVEVDLSKMVSLNQIEQIELNNEKLISNLELVDIYGITKTSKKCEFIATKNLLEGNIILEPNEYFEKYLIVYIPIKEINLEDTEINLFKNESHKLHFKVKPDNATQKIVNIEYDENLLAIKEDGSIMGIDEGETKIALQAENNTIVEEIPVIIKIKTEGIEVNSEKVTLTEGEFSEIQAKILPETVSEKTMYYHVHDEDIAKVDENGKISAIKEGRTKITITSKAEPVQTREVFVSVKKKEEPAQNQLKASENSIKNNYINGVLLVNKKYSIPSNYNPGTNQEALQAFNNMKSNAARSGISLWIVSGFRSYQTQVSIYNRNVNLYGEQTANTFSAKPGQSEHQTGLAFDINSTKWAFEDTREAKWLAEHCYEYGFIIRYPKGKEDITGYVYEPWHIRYVGKENAKKIKESGLCLEEYLGVN